MVGFKVVGFKVVGFKVAPSKALAVGKLVPRLWLMGKWGHVPLKGAGIIIIGQ